MKTIGSLFAATASVLLLSVVGLSPAHAQSISEEPNFGSVRLSAGFTPDPYVVEVTAGGSIDAFLETPLPVECVGKISDAPDFRVTSTAGSFPLVFRTISTEDTTLVINGPDTSWSCDDDSFGDGDAEVTFRRPRSGVYDIWVGTYGEDTIDAVLIITETP